MSSEVLKMSVLQGGWRDGVWPSCFVEIVLVEDPFQKQRVWSGRGGSLKWQDVKRPKPLLG